MQADALYDTKFSSLLLEFRNVKSYISQHKIALSQKYAGKEMLIDIKQERKHLQELEDDLHIITEKVNNPLSVEDLLKDTITEAAFPYIGRPLKFYVFIPRSESGLRGASRK